MRALMSLQFALRHKRFPASLHITFVRPLPLVHALYVHLKVVVSHELPIAALDRAHELLLILVMSANMHLQAAVCVVLLPTIRLVADERLELTRREIDDIGAARVNPLVLFQVLQVVEGFAAVRVFAHEGFATRCVMNVHVCV